MLRGPMLYHYLADFLATVHVAWVLFVVFGLVAVYVGWWAGWGWVHNRWFRGIHLAMIVGVVLRATVLDMCPITIWEEAMHEMGTQAGYEASRFGQVMHDALHPVPAGEDLPHWVYLAIYAAFGALVIGTLCGVPVHWRGRPREREAEPEPAAV